VRAIASEFFAGSSHMAWPLVALVIFIAVFVVAAALVIRRGARSFEPVSRLPLEDERHE
jgi:hypothetical protein